jgi:CheY-like chemotaxis protein
VHSTATGAVERALAVWPDVVLLDVLLPDGDGWELLRALKAEPRTRAIPVLVVSVVDEPARARDLGAAGLLLKPLSRAALTQTLRQLFTLGEKPPAQELPAGAPGRRRPQILLAEDSEANIATLSDYLAAKGYDVAVARNGSEAVARAQEKRPELILMDIQMPGMDGLEAARRIRARADLAHIPIIALTALAMPGDRERCLEAGASDYLTKPVNLRTLLAAIAQCCPALRDDGCAG